MNDLFNLNEHFLLINSVISPDFNQSAPISNPLWWAVMILLLTGMIGISIILNQRAQQSTLIAHLRVKISSDLHDEVGSILSGLAMQSEIMELQATLDQKEKLQRITTLSRNALASMRDTVWALDARKDNWESLLDRLYEHAEETLSVKNIGFKIDLEGIEAMEEMPLALRQNLYLIAKEAITNTAKYSSGDQMTIRIEGKDEKLAVQIRDNGQVEQNSIKTSGLGLSNMKMRAERIGGKLSINTQDGFFIDLAV